MSKSAELARLIRDRAGDAAPEYGLILGSGLGHLAEAVQGVAIPYSDLPGFPHAGVSGHVPKLVIGQLEGRRVAVFGGRSHYYESGRPDAMRLPLEVLAELGCDRLLLTNAAVRSEGFKAWIASTGMGETAFLMFFFAGIAFLAALVIGLYARRYPMQDYYRAG